AAQQQALPPIGIIRACRPLRDPCMSCSSRIDRPLPASFFQRDAQCLAQALLGKVIRHYHNGLWLSARIIETEAYYLAEKGSHASLGYTEKRRALFMDGGYI